MSRLLIILVQVYRWVLSPLKVGLMGPGARCRFEPSCSEYAVEALRMHGAWVGVGLAARRVGRCHPWGGCGHDPVPRPRSEGAKATAEAVDAVTGKALLPRPWAGQTEA